MTSEREEPVEEQSLSPADAAAVDQALEAYWQGQAAPADPRERQAAQWLELIGRCPAAEPAADLVARTMARVQQASRLRVVEPPQVNPGSALPWRWGELMTVAAVLVISFSLLWPMLGKVRDDARRIQCAANLGVSGQAAGAYAAGNEGVLPRRGSWTNTPWWKVGQPAAKDGHVESNSAHLYLLAKSKFLDSSYLACPENATALRELDPQAIDWPTAQAVSYSYQNQFTSQPLHVEQSPQMAILADRNPFVSEEGLLFASNQPLNVPSRAHHERGQNILLGDGGVTWDSQPILPNGDNIWLINGVRDYSTAQQQTHLDDSFLIP